MTNNNPPMGNPNEPGEAYPDNTPLNRLNDEDDEEFQFEYQEGGSLLDGDEEDAFYGEKTKDKDLIKDPEHFEDVTQKYLDKRKRRLAYIIGGIVAVFLIAGGLAYYAATYDPNQDEPTPTETAGPQITLPPNEDGSIVVDREQPFLSIYPDAPTVEVAQTTTTIENNNSILTTDNHRLTFNETTITPATTQCIVTNPEDFCLTALINHNSQESAVYLLKDSAHSRFFDSAQNFQLAEVTGSPAAAVMKLTMANKNSPVLNIVLPNSSGLMIVLPENATIEDAQELAKNITVS